MIALYHLTGCDSTSKCDGKSSALKSNAAHNLQNLGKDPNNINLEMAEEFLANVYKPGTKCKTIDELRYHLYYHSKKTILNLPPTSRAIEGYIRRALFGTNLQLHCLDRQQLDPTKHWVHND